MTEQIHVVSNAWNTGAYSGRQIERRSRKHRKRIDCTEATEIHHDPPYRILDQALNRFRRTTTSSTMDSCVCSGAGEGAGSISSISTSSPARGLFLDGLGLDVVCVTPVFRGDPVLCGAFGVSGSSWSISSSSFIFSSSSSRSVSLSECVSVSIPS